MVVAVEEAEAVVIGAIGGAADSEVVSGKENSAEVGTGNGGGCSEDSTDEVAGAVSPLFSAEEVATTDIGGGMSVGSAGGGVGGGGGGGGKEVVLATGDSGTRGRIPAACSLRSLSRICSNRIPTMFLPLCELSPLITVVEPVPQWRSSSAKSSGEEEVERRRKERREFWLMTA
jgi:hypothetical protein